MSTPDMGRESLVTKIHTLYADRSPVAASAAIGVATQDTDVQLGLKASLYSEIKDLDKYKAEDKEWSPIQYFKHETEDKRILRIVSPFENRPDIAIELPEKPTDKYLQQLITKWKDIQHIVMLDQEMLQLIYEMGVRYVTKSPTIVEGPPAKSKSFAAWVFSTMIEVPYARMTCSANTRENYFMGSLMPSSEREGIYNIREVLTFPPVLERIKMYEEALKHKDKLNWKDEVEISTFLTSVKTLMRLEDPTEWLKKPSEDEKEMFELFLKGAPPGKATLNDNRVVLAYDIIASQTGLVLVAPTQYAYKDSDFMRLYVGGGMVVIDELNTIVDDGVQTVLLPTLEPKTQSVIVSAQRNPPEAKRNHDFFPVMTINPAGTGGRRILAEPTISRNSAITLGRVTDEYVENIINFYLTGKDPEIRLGGKLFRGRKDVKTPYRALETIPNRELVAKAITFVHTQITDWIESKPPVIGQARRDGGFYVFDQRKVTSVLDLMLEFYNKRYIESGQALQVRPVGEIDWAGMLRSALEEIYEAGIHGEVMDPKSDRHKVHELIEGLPIWDNLQQVAGKKPSPLKEVTTSRGRGLRPN